MRTQLLLRKAEGLLAGRLEQLEAHLQAGDEGAWPAFLEVLKVLAGHASEPSPRGWWADAHNAGNGLAAWGGTEDAPTSQGKRENPARTGEEETLRWSGQENLR